MILAQLVFRGFAFGDVMVAATGRVVHRFMGDRGDGTAVYT